MASAMAQAATRSIPPYTIPVGPRIRPPRLLPGTKAANTDPQPNEPPPITGDVWAQGKWRKPGSNAARDRRQVQSAKVEKALRHATHGMNIYAYSHMRTNQVVYSLSRIMQNNKILPQLLYHGKQTVPSSLRRDVWRPYFSIHFPETPAGAEAGLKAYRRLRELSTQRQLSPPEGSLIATKADVERAKAKYTPAELRDRLKNQEKKNLPIKNMPVENRLLPKQLRAKKLMNQKASSVADAAFVLGLINEHSSPAEELEAMIEDRARRFKNLSSRAARRLNRIRARESEKEAHIEARQADILSTGGQLGLTPHAARRIALEQAGSISAPWKGMEYSVHNPEAIQSQQEATSQYIQSTSAMETLLAGEERPKEFDARDFRSRYIKKWKDQHGEDVEGPPPEELEAAVKQEQEDIDVRIANYDKRLAEARTNFATNQQDRNKASRVVQVLWADLRDAAYAEKWSNNIYHGELESRAALKHERTLARQHISIDEEGNTVPGAPKKIVIQGTTTPHVFGVGHQTDWYQRPEQMNETRQKWRQDKIREWQDSKLERSKEVLSQIDNLHQRKQDLLKKQSELQPEYDALVRSEKGIKSSTRAEDATIQRLTDAEKYDVRNSMAVIKDNIAQNHNELTQMEKDYPSLYEKMSDLVDWRQNQHTYMNLLKLETEINSLHSAFENEDSSASERLQRIDKSLAQAHPDLARLESVEAELLSQTTTYRQKVARLEEQLSTLKAAEQTGEVSDQLYDTQRDLQNQLNLISSHRVRIWEDRLNSISSTLHNLEDDPSYKSTGITDLLRQRVYAEQEGNTDQVKSLDEELKDREDDKVMELLGMEVTRNKKAKVTEYDETMREKGIEMPAKAVPTPEKRGLWSSVKSMFGR